MIKGHLTIEGYLTIAGHLSLCEDDSERDRGACLSSHVRKHSCSSNSVFLRSMTIRAAETIHEVGRCI